MSYKNVKESALNFGAGLRFHLEQQPKTLITIFAETRAEWIISCFGCYTQVIKIMVNYRSTWALLFAYNKTVQIINFILSEYWSRHSLYQPWRWRCYSCNQWNEDFGCCNKSKSLTTTEKFVAKGKPNVSLIEQYRKIVSGQLKIDKIKF